MADGEIFKKLGSSRLSGFQEFYTAILYGNSRNFFTPRNKFKVSWSGTSDIKYVYGLMDTVSGSKFEKALNSTAYLVDGISLPDLELRSVDPINDGRGTYLPNTESMPVPSSNEFSMQFKERMTAAEIAIFEGWILLNGYPFQRPVLSNCWINHYSDSDGKNIVGVTRLSGVRPLKIESIRSNHNNREILIRSVTFGFTKLVEKFNSGK